jgi:hypothetical protein
MPVNPATLELMQKDPKFCMGRNKKKKKPTNKQTKQNTPNPKAFGLYESQLKESNGAIVRDVIQQANNNPII